MLHKQLCSRNSISMVGNIAFVAHSVSSNAKGSSFPGFVPPSETVNSKSVVGVKMGDSSILIGYHVEKFISTWSVEDFVA